MAFEWLKLPLKWKNFLMQNSNPKIFKKGRKREIFDFSDEQVTTGEIFDFIRNINDPEHPLSLEELNVVSEELITINGTRICVLFTPTIPHCSMATLIGLSIRVMLLTVLPPFYKVQVKVTPGTHQSELQVNKQLKDKERVLAALENSHLSSVVNQCLKTCL